MEDAVKVIKRKFKHMKGFELHKVYFVDDEFSESTLQAVNAKGKKQGWTEKFTQVVYFQTDFQTPIKESDINNPEWEANTEYIHYGWTLARSDVVPTFSNRCTAQSFCFLRPMPRCSANSRSFP